MARSTSDASVVVTYTVTPAPDRWLLEEEDLPESSLHGRIIRLLVWLLEAWIVRTRLDAQVDENIAVRWDPDRPRVGADPDVLLMQPAPPEGRDLVSLQLWKPEHHPPRVAVEVVSINTAEKDYLDAPARYGRAGVKELWVFDPRKFGPAVPAGPYLLQVWRRTPKGTMRRVYAGDGPAFSRELGAWLVVTDGGEMLRVANDAAGRDLWPTAEEERDVHARARADAEAQAETARKARDEAEARTRQLEAELARLRGGASPQPKKPRKRAR